jgi:hypothetical protein
MSLGFVNIHGQTIVPPAATKKAAATRKEAPAEYHKGFRVEGHRPGAMEAARDFQISLCAEWEALPERERPRRLSEGLRPPKPWDEAIWRQRTKPKPVRSKPYEVPEAAEKCAEMARKAGWLDVRVTEVKKEKPA